MSDHIIQITLTMIANYNQDAVRTVKIIKNDLNDDLFKNVKNTDESLLI